MLIDGLELEDVLQLVTLLAEGLTDAAAGRRLGWSERTVQRRVSQLLSTLGATSRFQAGFLLALRLGPVPDQKPPESLLEPARVTGLPQESG